MNEENKTPEGALPYRVEETRAHRKNFAPAGHIYIVIRFDTKDKKYSNYRAIPFSYTPEQKAEVCEILWNAIVKKFNL
jgi:hypothetical protein